MSNLHKDPLFVLAADNAFVLPLVVALTSLARRVRRPIRVLVLTTNIPNSTRARIASHFESAAPRNSVLGWTNLANSSLSRFPIKLKHLSPLTYARLLIPRLVSEDETEVIYFDCDTVITGDITEWCETEPTGQFPVSAVRDFIAPSWGSPSALPDFLSKSSELNRNAFFNAGVMRINVTAWRDLKVEEACSTFINEYYNHCKSDQDALNYVFQSQWQQLHPKWNMQSTLERGVVLDSDLQRNIDQVSLSDNAIIHFCTRHKPWNSGIRPNGRINLWLKALEESRWFDTSAYWNWRMNRLLKLYINNLKHRLL